MKTSTVLIPTDERTGAIAMRVTTDGREICIVPKLFTFAITIGPEGDVFYDNSWCYESLEGVLVAWGQWDPTKSPEPEGWIRNPSSGRRRPDGDPTREYVSP